MKIIPIFKKKKKDLIVLGVRNSGTAYHARSPGFPPLLLPPQKIDQEFIRQNHLANNLISQRVIFYSEIHGFCHQIMEGRAGRKESCTLLSFQV